MLSRKIILLTFLMTTIASGAYAQNRFEIEPFVGARFGGRITINTPDVDYLPIDPSLNWGFTTGVGIIRHLFGEFMFNRQTTTLSAHDTLLNQTLPLTTNAHIDLYHFGLLYEFWVPWKLRPFVAGGIGDTHFDSHGVLAFEDRFSYNLGGGIKYLFAPEVALRAEVRWSPSRTTASSTTFCDPALGCFTTPISHHAQQGQADIGLEFRFGSWRR
jgi:hypothetical protein